MNERSAVHHTFVIERVYKAAPAKVFAYWSNAGQKEMWFSKADVFDFRVGGGESSPGGPPGGPIFTYESKYQDIVPDERIVYTYTLDIGDARMSVSSATVEFRAEGAGTKLILTEQGVFLDGHDTPEIREHGTREMLNKLGEIVEAAEEYTFWASRVVDAPRALVYEAWTKPEHIAAWWGPEGFTNTFQIFEPQPGGSWTFIMHGPNGVDYPNKNEFVEVGPERIVLRHVNEPYFELTATFEDLGDQTKIVWRQRLENEAIFQAVMARVGPANEQNLDRLEAELKRMKG